MLQHIPRNLAAVLTFGRPPLVFGAFACALWVMFAHHALAYAVGLTLLVLAMLFDWVDGWFADRYIPDSRLGPLVDRMMDRLVYSIIFPVLGAGMFWRLMRLERLDGLEAPRGELLHALFVLAICVLVLMRDQFAHFLRSFAERQEQGGEAFGLTRVRTLVASPMAVLLYAYAFYLPGRGWEGIYLALDWLDQLPLRVFYVVEILFLIVNIGSITLHLRKYGSLALNDICEDNEILRRRILAVFPNALTLMNALLGVAAVLFAGQGLVREALFILLGAAFFDKLDGAVARRLGLTEPLPDLAQIPGMRLGALLDDISDAISFCIAPGVIYYLVMTELGLAPLPLLPFWVVGTVYALAGFARLVYFIMDKAPIPGFFKGMPVPGAAMLTMSGIEITHQLARSGSALTQSWSLLAGGLLLLAAVIMNVYPVRYLHFGRWLSRHPVIMWCSLGLSVVLIFTPYFGMTLLVGSLLYLFSPLYTTGHIEPSIAALEQRASRPR